MTIDASRYSQRVSPGARGTKRSARVLPSLTTSGISSSKTQSHAVHHGGELHGYYEGDNWNSFFMNIHMFQSLKKSCFWSIDLCLHKTWEMLSCGLALPLRFVSSVADLMQPRVWTFIVAAFFSGGQFAFLQEEMSPALLSVGTDLFYGSFAFPMGQLCTIKRRKNGTIWIYLSLLTSS